jgi:hypothetical protein
MQLELGTTATSYEPYGARLAASEGTVERMFRLDRPPGTNPQYLFDAGGIQHYVNPAGKLECTYNSGAITITGTTTLSAGTIYTASLRFDATGVAIHLAGVQEASSVTALSTDLSALAYEGCKSDGTCQLDGVMFDAVYNTISRPDADLLSRATAAAAARRYADDASVSWHANFDRPDSIRTPRVVNL